MRIKLMGLIALVIVLGTSCKKENETAPQIETEIINPNHKTATGGDTCDGPSPCSIYPPRKN